MAISTKSGTPNSLLSWPPGPAASRHVPRSSSGLDARLGAAAKDLAKCHPVLGRARDGPLKGSGESPGREPRSVVPMPRSLFTLRWILGHVIVLLIVAGCVVAGFWQLDRLGERRSFNARVERQLALAPQPLDQVITQGSHVDPEAVAYRRVEVEGTYDPAREVVLAGRSLDDQTGNDLLTPLVTSSRGIIFVNRGWVPSQFGQPPVAQAFPPTGTVRLTGVLFPSESSSSGARQGRVSQIVRIDLGQLRQQVPYPTYPD